MKILVTGSSGFIGSHLVESIKDEHEVYRLDRWRPNRYVLGEEKGFLGDLTDQQFVSKLIEDLEPEIVVHLAAVTPVAYSHDHPYEVFEVNATGTMNLAHACMDSDIDIKQFVSAGTSEEYGNHDDDELPLTGDSELRPNFPYAISKVTTDHYLMYMHEAYGFPATVARPFNCYNDKTEILTNNGWKLFKDLSGNELVATLNPTTNTLEFQRPTDHVEAPYNRKMVCVSGSQIDLLVTPNHRMWVKRRYRPSYEIMEASELLKWKGTVLPQVGI